MLSDVTLNDGHFLDVGFPLTFGLFMGMADIVPKLRALTTKIALGHLLRVFHKSAATMGGQPEILTAAHIIPQQAILRNSGVLKCLENGKC